MRDLLKLGSEDRNATLPWGSPQDDLQDNGLISNDTLVETKLRGRSHREVTLEQAYHLS